MGQLLVEQLSYEQAGLLAESLEDEEGSGKNLYLKGTFIQGGVRNLNGRIYPIREIEKAVNEVNSIIDKGESVLGECDHPEKLTVNIDRVSHVITKMWMDNNAGSGKLKILPTPVGLIIKTLIESNIRLGVSSRGSGDVDEDGKVSDFEIVTVDIVARPSAPDAYPKPVYEALNAKRGTIIEDLSQALREDPKARKYLERELINWIRNLR